MLIFIAVLVFCGSITQWKGTVRVIDGIETVFNKGKPQDLGESLDFVWISGENGDNDERRHSEFALPIWAEFSGSGDIFLLDWQDQAIIRLTSSGRYDGRFARKGQGPGELSGSKSFVWMKEKIFVANRRNHRIEIFDQDGKLLQVEKINNVEPEFISYRSNKFYIGQSQILPGDRSRILEYDEKWNLARNVFSYSKFDLSAEKNQSLIRIWMTSSLRTAPQGFWIVFDFDNRIDFVDNNGRIGFRSFRELGWRLAEKDGKIVPEYPVHGVCDVDPDGNLYVICYHLGSWKGKNEVYKFGPDGKLLGGAFTMPQEGITMIRFDKEGHLFFSDGTSLYKTKIVKRK